MLYLIGSTGGPFWSELFARRDEFALMLSTASWREPWCRFYACDNDAFANRDDDGWWEREGERAWLRMLDKLPNEHPPLWALLPDVVADWPRTLERAHAYLPELRARELRVALALQDGCDFEEALARAPDAVFVGGSTTWKWRNVAGVVAFFGRRGLLVHVGRVNTARRVRACRALGVSSCDGTGVNRFPDEMLPLVLRELDRPHCQRTLCFEEVPA